MTKQDKVYSVNEIFTSIEGEGIRTGFFQHLSDLMVVN